jgi:hypothetical protein
MRTGKPNSSRLRQQRIDALLQARKLPVGPDRNDLRQLAVGLRYLEQNGLEAKVWERRSAIESLKAP